MQPFEELAYKQYYHLYNHGAGERDLFREPDNYEYFLDLYDKHISPIAETYAWVLMPNHFHLLIRIKGKEEVEKMGEKTKPPHQYFSNLFNAYTQALNKRYHTRGTLFERPFKRKLIDNEAYLKRVILYIHNNPVHHGFCEHPVEYAWSSYLTCVSIKPTKLHRETVIGWFDSKANFRTRHTEKLNRVEFDEWLGLK